MLVLKNRRIIMNFGKYDYEKEFANRSMAMFYGRKAIYIYVLGR